MISSGAQADEALKWYKLVLRKHDSDAVRIKIAMLLPSVFTSAEDMKQRWDEMLVRLKALLKRPKLTLPRDAYVSAADHHRSEIL